MSVSANGEQIPSEYLCPVSGEIMLKAVTGTTREGHSYTCDRENSQDREVVEGIKYDRKLQKKINSFITKNPDLFEGKSVKQMRSEKLAKALPGIEMSARKKLENQEIAELINTTAKLLDLNDERVASFLEMVLDIRAT